MTKWKKAPGISDAENQPLAPPEKSKKPRQTKTPKPKLGPLPWTDNDNEKIWELIGLLEKSENRVLLGTRKGQKTLGETKAHAERRIGELLFPDGCRIDIFTVQNRVHGKIASESSLTQSYRKHAKKLKITASMRKSSRLPVMERLEY
ncbi:hypothetical protein EV361DRAFT_1037888 [Lentinula raphanica]|nr:hypothetical protein EV361DRAFT_1037888 [Lentinula raphanica]